jgi:hypothetical protein
MNKTLTLQKNMLLNSMQATHFQLSEPAELVWLRLGLHSAGRDLNTVLQIDRLTLNSYTKKER